VCPGGAPCGAGMGEHQWFGCVQKVGPCRRLGRRGSGRTRDKGVVVRGLEISQND
jgi:hypothetical protein